MAEFGSLDNLLQSERVTPRTTSPDPRWAGQCFSFESPVFNKYNKNNNSSNNINNNNNNNDNKAFFFEKRQNLEEYLRKSFGSTDVLERGGRRVVRPLEERNKWCSHSALDGLSTRAAGSDRGAAWKARPVLFARLEPGPTKRLPHAQSSDCILGVRTSDDADDDKLRASSLRQRRQTSHSDDKCEAAAKRRSAASGGLTDSHGRAESIARAEAMLRAELIAISTGRAVAIDTTERQDGVSESTGKTESIGRSDSVGTNKSAGRVESTGKTESIGRADSISTAKSIDRTESTGRTESIGRTDSINSALSIGRSESKDSTVYSCQSAPCVGVESKKGSQSSPQDPHKSSSFSDNAESAPSLESLDQKTKSGATPKPPPGLRRLRVRTDSAGPVLKSKVDEGTSIKPYLSSGSLLDDYGDDDDDIEGRSLKVQQPEEKRASSPIVRNTADSQPSAFTPLSDSLTKSRRRIYHRSNAALSHSGSKPDVLVAAEATRAQPPEKHNDNDAALAADNISPDVKNASMTGAPRPGLRKAVAASTPEFSRRSLDATLVERSKTSRRSLDASTRYSSPAATSTSLIVEKSDVLLLNTSAETEGFDANENSTTSSISDISTIEEDSTTESLSPDLKSTNVKRTLSFREDHKPGRRDTFNMTSEELAFASGKPVSPTTGWDFKVIKRQKAICKSLDSGLQESSPPISEPLQKMVTSMHHLTIARASKSSPTSPRSRKPPRSPRASKNVLSFPSMVSEVLSPTCDVPCATPNKLLHKLVRRLSLKRRTHKEPKTRSSAEIERRGSSPLLGDPRAIRKRMSSQDSGMADDLNLTDAERTHSIDLVHESLYRGLLRCLLHPLGATETEVGFRPGDLVDHLRQVFNVDQDDHEYFVRDEIHNKPGKVQASVTVLEAKDMPDRTADSGGIYCLLTLVQPTRPGSKTYSPKNSPRNSPKSSPKLRKSPPRSPSLDSYDVLRTHGSKSLKDPKWNEGFHLDIDEILTDEIHLCVCYQDDASLPADMVKQPEKNGAIKSFFKNILQASSDHEKLIPGCIGRIIVPIRDIPSEGCDRWFDLYPVCRGSKSKATGQVRLQIAVSCRQTQLQGCFFSAEDYHQASLIVHKHAASNLKDVEGVDLSVSAKSRRMLNIFAVSNGISKLSQNILDLTVLLELAFTPSTSSVSENVLHRAMEELQMTWGAMHCGSSDYLQRMPLCDAEISLYRSATRRYVEVIIDSISDLPLLFPPCVDSIHVIKGRFGIAQHLLELDLWESIGSPQRDLSNALVAKLQTDVREWVDTHLDTIHAHSQVKDAVIPEVEKLAEVTNSLVSICTPLGVVERFYSALGLKYYRIVSFETERKTNGADVFIFQTIREDMDYFRLSVPNYQDWFQEAVVFWLHMFRTECTCRIQKALEIDKDFVLVTSLVKYSNSSVDAQTCFSEMICDGARVYASKIQNILERNCYYDKNEGQFDVTDRIGERALSTLQRLIRHAHEDILHMSARLLRSVCAKMSVEVQKSMEIFLVKTPEKHSVGVCPNVPRELLSESGVVLLLSVMDRDMVKTDDFAGEVVIALDQVPAIGVNETVDNSPVVMMPLKRPQLDVEGPFQVLEERSAWDKCAKAFVRERRRFIENQRQPTDTVKDKLSSFFKFWSKNQSHDEFT
ncbi:uncharacterized protein LOC101849661 [Aplysia californica]|uniref:Uncharacterized protein LOC101849661 n=1 Tax=Aplysia californica TaxID=6500 RepID=A0ABM1ADQ5_APLCA|nr:uncharacterized protein LOC101849661 [Aplysia californica]